MVKARKNELYKLKTNGSTCQKTYSINNGVKEIEQWTPLPMYCNNCGHLNYGLQRNDGKIKYECNKCRMVFVRTIKNRRHQTLEIYTPKGEYLTL